tara:strand:+ start:426 stop:596 length:171 start_codon:yes stop_codon:yes gene_type:complete
VHGTPDFLEKNWNFLFDRREKKYFRKPTKFSKFFSGVIRNILQMEKNRKQQTLKEK